MVRISLLVPARVTLIDELCNVLVGVKLVLMGAIAVQRDSLVGDDRLS